MAQVARTLPTICPWCEHVIDHCEVEACAAHAALLCGISVQYTPERYNPRAMATIPGGWRARVESGPEAVSAAYADGDTREEAFPILAEDLRALGFIACYA